MCGAFGTLAIASADIQAKDQISAPPAISEASRFCAALGPSTTTALNALLSRQLPGQFQFVDGLGPLLYVGQRGSGGSTSTIPFLSTSLPPTISILFWVKLLPGTPAVVLYGMGNPENGYLMLATDEAGAPMLLMFGEYGTAQIARAPQGAADLADGQLHSVAIVIDRAAGLVQMHVDGKSEVAAVTSGFSLQTVGTAFAQWTLAGSLPCPNTSRFSPRILNRALSQEEILALRPSDIGDWLLAQIATISSLETSLFPETLALFPANARPTRKVVRRYATIGSTR